MIDVSKKHIWAADFRSFIGYIDISVKLEPGKLEVRDVPECEEHFNFPFSFCCFVPHKIITFAKSINSAKVMVSI